MTPEAFISKWKAADLKERSAAQEHFIDLCHLLGEPTPAEADPKGESYCFERGATKTTGGKGWADVWKRGHFGWEYKGRGGDLSKAFTQLQQYAIALENPPLLVVCNLDRFRFHTNWTNTISVVHEIAIEELRDPAARQKLKAVLSDPEKLRPGQTRQALTEKAASDFSRLAQRLRERGHDPETVAHFINRLVFCMFAEDISLLPNRMFARMIDHARTHPEHFEGMARSLFGAMRGGGMVGFEPVEWFNGGLFDDDTALPLDKEDIALTAAAAALDWAEVDPSIFGTLFERGLDPDKRSQLGAHYTDRDKIMLIIEPVIERPLLAEWEGVKQAVAEALERAKGAKSAAARTRAHDGAVSHYRAFLDRLRAFTVLDPACGSGNFLYLALRSLKDLENRVMIEAEALGLQREFPAIGPGSVKGIEINAYAAELARVTVWIGEIQWMIRNGFGASRNPILKPLDTIECRDALLNPDGSEAAWPDADVFIGNPPFLGDREHRMRLGNAYTERLRSAYGSRVGGRADLVVYWLQKATEKLLDNKAQRFGFVATKSVAKGASRAPLELLATKGKQLIYDAWTNEQWVVDGAAVRVSLLCATAPQNEQRGISELRLNGMVVANINPDLTTGIDVTRAVELQENQDVAFQGVKLTGPFDLSGGAARTLLTMPLNPNGLPNSDVIARLYDIDDVVGRDSDRWTVDFGCRAPEAAAMLYEAPFKHIESGVVPYRNDPEQCRNQDQRLRQRYWEFERPRPEMRRALAGLQRFIVTPESSEHRIFIFVPITVLIQGSLFCIARDDYTTFGVLSSGIHEVWATAQGNRLGAGNQRRYNIGVAFKAFPFPEGLTPNLPALSYADDPRAIRIAAAAKRLDELRRNWLNPSNLVRVEPDVVPGFPDRILPVDDKAATVLRTRTLTNLYNQRPTWLDNAHRELDATVAAAYGWPEDISTEDALARLLELNTARSTPLDARAAAE
ncbi:MAG TPA: DNA methyltransferase [Microvirga sp.]|jgi:type II restriction/modification system DNA methylase subunit YeeA|nr:DNA methyltransferase [Microvirga sp.]